MAACCIAKRIRITYLHIKRFVAVFIILRPRSKASPPSMSAYRGTDPWGEHPLLIAHRVVSDSPPDRSPQSCPTRSIQPSDHLSERASLAVSFGRFLLAGAPSSTGLSLYSLKSTASYTPPLGSRLPPSGRTRQGVKCTSSVARVTCDHTPL